MLCFSAITDSRCVSRLLLSPLNFSKGHYFLRLLPHNLPWRQVSLTGAPSTYAHSDAVLANALRLGLRAANTALRLP